MIVVSGSSRNPGGSGVGIDHHTDIVRYTSDGQPDPAFGNGGTLTLDGPSSVRTSPIQPDDGRLLLVGTADTTPPAAPPGSVTELSVMRLEPDGTPDLTFGDDGTANVSVTGSQLIDRRARPRHRRRHRPPARRAHRRRGPATGGFNPKFAVARLLSDGTLDTDFTDTGAMTIDFFGFTDVAESVAVTDDGKIVVSGQVQNPGEVYGVARLAPSDSATGS